MSANLQYDKDYIEDTLKDQIILVDNTFLVDLSKDGDKTLLEILQALKNANCELLTTNSVVREFSRGAKTLEKYEDFEKMINEAGIEVVNVPQQILAEKKIKEFIIAYSHEAKDPSLTDTDLAILVYKYSPLKIRLLSANYRDLPNSLLKREDFISYDMNGEIRTHGFYTIAEDNILNRTIDKYR